MTELKTKLIAAAKRGLTELGFVLIGPARADGRPGRGSPGQVFSATDPEGRSVRVAIRTGVEDHYAFRPVGNPPNGWRMLPTVDWCTMAITDNRNGTVPTECRVYIRRASDVLRIIDRDFAQRVARGNRSATVVPFAQWFPADGLGEPDFRFPLDDDGAVPQPDTAAPRPSGDNETAAAETPGLGDFPEVIACRERLARELGIAPNRLGLIVEVLGGRLRFRI